MSGSCEKPRNEESEESEKEPPWESERLGSEDGFHIPPALPARSQQVSGEVPPSASFCPFMRRCAGLPDSMVGLHSP